MFGLRCFCLVGFLVVVALSQTVIPDEDWGYVEARPNAHLFWWLYGMEDKTKRDTAPVVIWLQGGPGASSSGYGNFEEIGPLDVNLQPRKVNWIQSANVIFIDSPVGSGFSYTTSDDAYCQTDEQVGIDLVAVLKGIQAKLPLVETLPFWIFCESYGGKESTSFGVAIVNAIQQGSLKLNFKGVTLGDSWISPIDFVMAYGDYLLATSEVDNTGYSLINKSANTVLTAVNTQQWETATQRWSSNQDVIFSVTFRINFYNILDRTNDDLKSYSKSKHSQLRTYHADPLLALMNGQIKQKLGIPANVTWGAQSQNVFFKMAVPFMKPYISQVDFLLSKGVEVAVYSGNLDLICCTTGTIAWMDKLKWPDYPKFVSVPRKPLFLANKMVGGFQKKYNNLSFFNILSAGHMAPIDQPEAAQTMLKTIIYS